MSNFVVSTEDQVLYRYIKKVNSFPMLSEDDELFYSKKWHDEKCRDAAHKLITSHLRLVIKIAMQFRSYGIALMDLISEGNIGLMNAVKKFNPYKGFKLATYAIWWIKAFINDYIIKSWSIVKIATTTNQRKLFYQLKKTKDKIYKRLDIGSNTTNEQLLQIASKELDVPHITIKQMDQRLNKNDISISTTTNSESNTIEDNLADCNDNQEEGYIKTQEKNKNIQTIRKALSSALDERENFIFTNRLLREKPLTLKRLAEKFNISCERVRQIESKAMQKIKDFVTNSTL